MTVQSPYGFDRRGWQHSGLAVTAPLGYISAMQTVVETPTFMRQADKLFSEDERRELIDFLAKNPLAGDKIPGTGGRPQTALLDLRTRQARRRTGDVLLSRRSNAGLCATRLYEGNENRSDAERKTCGFGPCSRAQGHTEGDQMNTFGNDLIQSLTEALAHAKGEGPAIVHVPVAPREVRKQANLTQAQMAPLMGMSLSGYRKWEQGTRRVSGPAATLLRVIEREPEAVKRALLSAGQI